MRLRPLWFALLLVTCVPAHGLAQSSDRFDVLIGLARVKRDAGEVAAARRYFEQARLLRNFEPGLLTEYFWLLSDVAPAEAVVVGSHLLARQPSADKVREGAIAAAVASGQEAAALALAQAGVQHEPERAVWHRHVAESYARQNRAEAAARAYESAIGAGATGVDVGAGLALALEASGAFGPALDAWRQVPAGVRAEHADWERSRLRAVARVRPVPDAAAELGAWLADRPDDREIRERLVDLWTRAGQLERALSTLQPLLTGPDHDVWQAREIDLSRAAGHPEVAINRLETVVASGRASRLQRLALAELLIESTAFSRATAVLEGVDGGPTCDTTFMALADRVPDRAGTTLLVDHLAASACTEHQDWVVRGVERATAEGRHAVARAVLATLPASARQTTVLRRLEGQLRQWTGDAAGAVELLSSLVADEPGDTAARDTLVDAYRTVGDAYGAWRIAEPLLSSDSTSVGRRLTLAELALEADRPERVEALLAAIPHDVMPVTVENGLRGRALAALGRPAEAIRLLESIDPSDLTPPAALALLDSLLSVRGVDRAIEVAARLPPGDDASTDLLARRAMLESLAGSAADAEGARGSLFVLAPGLLTFVDAEVALVEERPLDALSVLARVPPGLQPGRAADLRVTALAGSGNVQVALNELAALRRARPAFVPFVLREAELVWRLQPDAAGAAGVLALPGRFPGNRYAAIAAARVLAFEKRDEEVVQILGGPSARDALPIEGRVLMARALSARGRDAEALETVRDISLRGPASLFRAELIARVEGPDAAARAFRRVAESPDGSPAAYLAWAAATRDMPARATILAAGVARFGTSAPLFAGLAVARAATRDRDGSLAAADRAVSLDIESGEGWFQLIANTAVARTSDDLAALLDRFDRVVATRPALAVATAGRVAALVRSADDRLLEHALEWLRVDMVDGTLELSRDLARVQLLAAGERWFEARTAADSAVHTHPESTAARRLRADVLSWSGRHDEGIEAYADYLDRVPTDVDARRQQARVAGWAGHLADARRLYAALRETYPDDTAVAAEARAKSAWFDGRWREAVERYGRWLEVEPDNSEARFEFAQALRASGDVERADAALAALAPVGGHRLAGAALEREAWRRQPSVVVASTLTSAAGYGGARLLDLHRIGGSVRASVGTPVGPTVSADLASVQAVGSATRRAGYELGMSGEHRMSTATVASARVSLWDVSGPGRPIVQVAARATWAPRDRWTLGGGVERELLLDTIDTIDRRLVATGIFGAANFEAPEMSFEIRTGRQYLSDGNERSRVSLSATRALSERLGHLRAVGWGEFQNYSKPGVGYFSPQRFLRLDGGLEYTHLLSRPRFRGDRTDAVNIGYLVGTDSNGALYQHPSIRVGWEMSPSLALSARADMVASSGYREHSLFVSVHLTGGVLGH